LTTTTTTTTAFETSAANLWRGSDALREALAPKPRKALSRTQPS
jgi:hypothetical protein